MRPTPPRIRPVWALHTAPLPLDPVLPAPAPAAGTHPRIRRAGPPPPADPLAPLNAVDIPAPAFDAANQAVTGDTAGTARRRLPHLASPENLPPGTTMDEGALPATTVPTSAYLKELWHAIQTQDISGKEALLALTQRR